MNNFGGDWTEKKIRIVVEYASAYLQIMNVYAKQYNWKLLYFDGFAGTGTITTSENQNTTEINGAALRVLEILEPRTFDDYYFVELSPDKAKLLKRNTSSRFQGRNIWIKQKDCNEVIKEMAKFLSVKGRNYKVLAFIDPCGMQLRWESLQALQKYSVDCWILVPTGLGVSRLLVNDSNISEAWVAKLMTFLGMTENEIREYFYERTVTPTLFGVETGISKKDGAIERSAMLYQERLSTLFKHVSKPFILKNKGNTIMYHFFMASNNQKAVKIANEIIAKYNKM